MKKIHTRTYTGAAAIAASFPATGRGNHVLGVDIKFSAAPTTAENLTFTKNSNAGAAYDTLLWTYDPGTVGDVTSINWLGPGNNNDGVYLAKGDSLDIAYTNTDTVTYGITVSFTEGA